MHRHTQPIFTRIGWSCFTAWKAMGEASIAWLPQEQLEQRQSRRLRAMIRHAWDSVPYYRDWLGGAGAEPEDIRTSEDLKRLPMVDKLALTLEPERFAAAGYEARDGLTLLSSGTSGRRRRFRFDAAALFDALAAGRRQRFVLRNFVGKETAYREAVLNREGSAGAQLRNFWESRGMIPAAVELSRRRFGPHLPYPELLAGLNEFQPHVVRGIGSHLGAFFRWVAESGRTLVRPRAIVYGADAMTPANRSLIERELRIPVLSTYQAVEALRIGFECEARCGFHISTDQVVVRVVDASGRDVAPGQRGELILSNLTNRAMVVLNYHLGDMVTLGRGPCECGRTLPVIENIDGRLDDLIARPDGTWIHALTLLPQLQAVNGVSQVQIVQEAVEQFTLRVVWAAGGEMDCAGLTSRMAAVLGPAAQVRVESVPRLEQEPSAKVKTVICRVPRR
jgi:phenylacetate-CoA ligase